MVIDKSAPGVSDSSVTAPAHRRWLRRLIALVIVFALLSLLTTWLMQPKQLVPLILSRAGKALSLEITADTDAEVRLRGEPQLLIHRVVVREPGAKTAILRADRLLLALPWSTLRKRGKDPIIKRVEMDVPILDVPALQAWLRKRPPSEETTIPTLTDGLRINDGHIENDDWRIEDINVDLPSLHPQQPVNARIRGRYLDAPIAIPFDLAVAMSKPDNDAGIAVIGPFTVERGHWRLQASVKLSGPLHLGSDEITMTPATLGVSARYLSGDTSLPFSLGLYGQLRFDEATWRLAPAGVALRGTGAMPTLDAHGTLALGRRLALQLDGVLPQWPEAWPALPPPVSTSTSPLPFALRYDGKPDLSEAAGLALRRDAMAFDSRFRLHDVLAWVEQAGGSVLPPLDGHLSAPALEISGAMLEGVEIEFDDEDTP